MTAPESSMEARQREPQFYAVSWLQNPFRIQRTYFGPKRIIFAMAAMAQDCVFECCIKEVLEVFDKADDFDISTSFEDQWHGFAAVRRLRHAPLRGI